MSAMALLFTFADRMYLVGAVEAGVTISTSHLTSFNRLSTFTSSSLLL